MIDQQNQKIEDRDLEFVYQARSNGKNLKLEILNDVYFLNPKNLEIAFSENTKPQNQLTSLETFSTISKLVKLNPDLFFDFLNKGYIVKKNFNQLSQLEQTIMYKEVE